MELGLAGKVALVPGASSGLGRACALALAREGARLVVCARRSEPLAAVEQELRDRGSEVLALPADVGEEEDIERLVAAAVQTFGALHVLVGNIGGPAHGATLQVADTDLEAAVRRNLLAQIHLVRQAVPHMQAAGWGRICLIGSTGVREPLPGHVLASTVRSGLWAWAKTLSHELAGDDITINMVLAGFHLTERNLERGHSMAELAAAWPHMAGRAGDPADFGSLVTFLCSEPARWVTGSAINADGGTTLSLL